MSNWLFAHAIRPFPLRLIFALLRRFMPILKIGNVVVVSRYLDVVDVLRRDQDFTVAEIYGPATDRLDGPFVLSLDKGARYDLEHEMQLSVVRPEDLDEIRTMVRKEATRLIAAATKAQIDVVNGYARAVALRVGSRYFGVPMPDEAQMGAWLRAIFWDIFANVANDAGVHARAVAADAAFRAHLDAAIARRKREILADPKAPEPKDVMGRMIALQLAAPNGWPDDATIRRNLTGMYAGTVDNTSKFFTLALAELLRRPRQLALAQQAAAAGDGETVRAFLYEAARFDPVTAVLARHASRDSWLAAGTRHATFVPHGSTVVLGNGSAMFDRAGFTDAATFDIDRESGELHFGYGLHRCLGYFINGVQLGELGTALLEHAHLRPARGRAGTVTFAGTFPDRFVVELA